MKKPLLSIVIANYNFGHLLSASLESIIHQNCNDYEIIIVDGGSKDNSVDVIKKYEKYISWWVSEPDNGQTNAFNKGFAHAKGDFFTWLNADDILLPGTISALKRTISRNPSADFVTGNMVRFNEVNHKICEAAWGPHCLPRFLQGQGRPLGIYGPTTFWKRSVYEKLGPLDESLYYVMDTEYWWRMVMAGCRQVRVNHYCWGFRMHIRSKTAFEMDMKHYKKLYEESRYIENKTGFKTKRYWRYIGVFFRIIDLSLFKHIYNMYFVCGKDFQKYFNLKYQVFTQ